MKREIKVLPTLFTDCLFPGSYVIRGVKRVLISEYEFKEFPANTPLKDIPDEVNFSFGKKRAQMILSWETKEDGTSLDPWNDSKRNTVERFYMEHPSTMINGKFHQYSIHNQGVYFDLVDVNMKVVTDYQEWETKIKITAFLNEQSFEKIRDIAFFYSVIPTGKTQRQLILELADFNKGKLFVKDINQNTLADAFVSTWIKEDQGDKNYVVNVKKAISLNIIETRMKDGVTAFYVGADLVGTSETDVVKFCKLNMDVYEKVILPGIRDYENFSSEEAASETEKNMVNIIPSDLSLIIKKRSKALDLYDELFKSKANGGLGLGTAVKVKRKLIEKPDISIAKLDEFIQTMEIQKSEILQERAEQV